MTENIVSTKEIHPRIEYEIVVEMDARHLVPEIQPLEDSLRETLSAFGAPLPVLRVSAPTILLTVNRRLTLVEMSEIAAHAETTFAENFPGSLPKVIHFTRRNRGV